MYLPFGLRQLSFCADNLGSTQSFLVALFRGSQILAESLIKVQKKLCNPTKEITSSLIDGTFAVWNALSLLFLVQFLLELV
jgi:hypothetical protein